MHVVHFASRRQKPEKPGKVNVVSDCAAQFSGKSLNDHFYRAVLSSLTGILIRFCQKRIAVVGDVKAMYHRVQVYDEDQQLLRFLSWKDRNIQGPIKKLCIKVQEFGSGPSGFGKNTALRRCTNDGIGRFLEHVIKSIHTNFLCRRPCNVFAG